MDIGTKKDPGRELQTNDAKQIGGGQMLPDPDPNPADPLGIGGGGPPVDYTNPNGLLP